MPPAPPHPDSTPVLHAGGVGAEQAWNERALAEPVREPVLRFWRHPAPGVVLGASQYKLLPGLGPQEIEVATRRAGGGAVLAGPWMLSASVLLPPGHALARAGILGGYEWIGGHFAAALQALGLPARPAPDKRDAGELAWACFAGISPWEVLLEGRKIVGLAQRRSRTGVLLAAGLLLDTPDWPLLCAVMGRPQHECAQLAAATADAHQALGFVPDAGALAAGLARRLLADLGGAAAAASCGTAPAPG
jgi:lipoate-protein ligase A